MVNTSPWKISRFSFRTIHEARLTLVWWWWCALPQPYPALCDSMDCSPPGTSVHGDFPGKNSGVGCHFLLQGSSQPRDWTWISCISGRFFTAEPPYQIRKLRLTELNLPKVTEHRVTGNRNAFHQTPRSTLPLLQEHLRPRPGHNTQKILDHTFYSRTCLSICLYTQIKGESLILSGAYLKLESPSGQPWWVPGII